MVFTPDNTIVVRSKEYGDGSEYDMPTGSSHSSYIPDHYVKRLWRKSSPLIGGSGGVTIQFTNKDSLDRSVLFSASEQNNLLVVKTGGYGEDGPGIARVQWSDGSGKVLEKCSLTLGNKTGLVKELLKKSNALSTSRTFIGPDGLEYKWKIIWVGNDPAFPETTFRTLFAKDSKHPIATTSRLTERDGRASDPSYPLYIAERGLKLTGWIVATLVLMERIQV